MISYDLPRISLRISFFFARIPRISCDHPENTSLPISNLNSIPVSGLSEASGVRFSRVEVSQEVRQIMEKNSRPIEGPSKALTFESFGMVFDGFRVKLDLPYLPAYSAYSTCPTYSTYLPTLPTLPTLTFSDLL